VKLLVAKSWLWLLGVEVAIPVLGLRGIYWLLRNQEARMIDPDDRCPSSLVSHAVDLACVLYFKEVKCLQRSAVAALLLRRHGWNAQMVLGAQVMPLKNHAWVELNGEVVNDKPYMHEMYKVLERC
jgi:hypothetical protein